MRRLQDIQRRLKVLILALPLAVAGCGDSSGPGGPPPDQPPPDAPYSAEGTKGDLDAVDAAFASPAYMSFAALSASFAPAMSASAGASSASVAALEVGRDVTRGGLRAAATRAARALAATLPRARGHTTSSRAISASNASVAAAALGTTFIYDLGQARYVASDRPGAPANGVRFILYAVGPGQQEPADPLTEVGYADLIDRSTDTAADVSVIVGSGTAVYLDYHVTASSTESSGTVSVTGYITDGTTRANFEIGVNTSSASNGTLSFDYHLDVDPRNVSVDLTFVLSGLNGSSPSATLALTLRGPHGRVTLSGNFGEQSGTISVRVNGQEIAVIQGQMGDEDPVIVGTDGHVLTDAELAALKQVFEVTKEGLDGFARLLSPLALS